LDKLSKIQNSKLKFHLVKGIITSIILFVCGIANAQTSELRFTKITDEKGEDPGATFAIDEDSTGFLWFGTVDGLFRYDGFQYKIYRNEKNNPNSLAGNTIRSLCVSRDNKLWIGTQGNGLDCLDLRTEKMTHYSYTKKNKNGISGNDIWALTEDRKGNIWVGVFGDGIDMLDKATNSFRHYHVLPKGFYVDESITIRSIYEDSQGIIWVGLVRYGLSALDPKTGNIVNYRNNPEDPTSIGSNDINHIFEDSQKRLIVCAFTGGLNFFNRKTNTFTKYKTNKQDANSLISELVVTGIENKPYEYWIGSEYGLSIINLKHSTFTTYQHEIYNQNSLTDNRIRALFKDSRGIIWIASEAGVDKIIEQQNFRVFKNKPGNPNSIPVGIVRSIYEDNQKNIWFGIIDNDLVRYNQKLNKFTRFTHNPFDFTSISGSYISSIFQDSKGNLWFGEWNTGLNSYNIHDESFKLVAGTKNTKAKLADTKIQFIKEAKPGVLWIGTGSGINRYDTRTQTCSYINHDEHNSNSLSGNAVQSNAFVQDSDGNIWVGTWSEGLNKIEFADTNQNAALYKHWKFDPVHPEKLNNNNVISLFLDRNVLWIGTFGGGLNAMNIKTGTFKHYTTENGLSNNIIFAIFQDNDHNLWLSTDKGLSKFNPRTETFQNYSKSDGLQDDHFFWGSSFKSPSGELYFGGINGVNCFFPHDILKNTKAPVPVLTDLKIFEQSVAITNTKNRITTLQIPYNKSYVTFEYAALDYTEQSKDQYLIKMNGLDNEWHNIGTRRLTSYSNLPSGNYTFQLKVVNKDGVWSKDELKVNLTVLPPWWNTWLARIIFLLIIVGSFWAFYLIRVRILKAQTRKLETLVISRTSKILTQKEELQSVNKNLTKQKEELSEALLQLKKTQNQLVESEKMASIGILTAGVAHEINNPLNFIQAGIYGIEDFFEENPNCKTLCNNHNEIISILERIKTGVSRVSAIVTSLNHFSRQTESNNQHCMIHTIIDSCLLILNSKLKYKIEIKKHYANENITVMGNEGKLHQAFLNILGNAVQAIQDKGEIEITTEISGDTIQISIKDNGCGIKKENLAKIFDPFFTTKEAGIGTGLGLFIMYGIIKEHFGNIVYKSEEEKGTEAIITLPIIIQPNGIS
jgi:signal transduction histidine kinase/ligand-binding sensor domain-containing protein